MTLIVDFEKIVKISRGILPLIPSSIILFLPTMTPIHCSRRHHICNLVTVRCKHIVRLPESKHVHRISSTNRGTPDNPRPKSSLTPDRLINGCVSSLSKPV